MYETNLASEQKVQAKSEAASIRLSQRFDKVNAEQTELVHKVQNKLHSLLNKRMPEKDPSEDIKPMVQDFISAIEASVSKVESNNYRLSAILRHLDEIV